MNNPWCESCSSKNVCYTSITRPKCYTPITNTYRFNEDTKEWIKNLDKPMEKEIMEKQNRWGLAMMDALGEACKKEMENWSSEELEQAKENLKKSIDRAVEIGNQKHHVKIGDQMMTIEECNKFFDTLKILVLEHPIVADWWVEIMDRYDDILQKKGADDEVD